MKQWKQDRYHSDNDGNSFEMITEIFHQRLNRKSGGKLAAIDPQCSIGTVRYDAGIRGFGTRLGHRFELKNSTNLSRER
jgi:hypothetical protein